jgi:putative endopeptidase
MISLSTIQHRSATNLIDMKNWFLLSITLVSFVACKTSTTEESFIAIKGIDSTRQPGDNFFNYVNAKW